MTISPDSESLSHLSLEVLQKQLSTSDRGLSQTEAKKRLLQDGEN
ncbi:cation-transporting P-type ATPase [Tumidithrix elongata RA019]|uniref:Cation-transporting P-type ATPase n=1 Tax=Tumidithrix elongata BACA0141 TaxID=2716417 RepID=A0AAW9Q8T2_9CYAN|nr:cation-transporting P-type ATPase [Tumidithrix elongata RA019]